MRKERPIKIFYLSELNRLLKRLGLNRLNCVYSLIKVIVSIISHPISTALIVFFQLVAGAVLGANLGTNFNSFKSSLNFDSIENIKLSIINNIDSNIILLVFIVFIITLIKAISDYLYSVIEDKKDQKRRKEQMMWPEKSWLDDYFKHFNDDFMSYNDKLKEMISKNEFDSEIISDESKKLLNIIRALSAKWGGNNINDCSINIMYLFDTNSIEPKFKEYWNKNKIFFDARNYQSALNQITGVLSVIASINKSSSKFFEKTGNHDPLMLPVVFENDSNFDSTSQLIPGAPAAIYHQSPQYIGNVVKTFYDVLHNDFYRYYSPFQADQIVERYESDKTTKSLLSIPLLAPFEVTSDYFNCTIDEPIGVLNIYCNNENFLNGNHEVFIKFLTPFLPIIASSVLFSLGKFFTDESGESDT